MQRCVISDNMSGLFSTNKIICYFFAAGGGLLVLEELIKVKQFN
jgi:hypothetical protein